ncbi:MAG: hypothetical protein FWD43_01525 [Coriobacteriia bacterium]|nr:hypothetical protein [Coriobacteriia bacterium]
MPEKSLAPMATAARMPRHKVRGRSALGIGVTTLVTVLVVMLLAAFSVLSLASARSDMRLSSMSAQSVSDYYAADSEATMWYSALDSLLARSASQSTDWDRVLRNAGYSVQRASDGGIQVRETFAMGPYRELVVTVAIAENGTPMIRQWQTFSVAANR